MPLLKDKDNAGSICLFDISKVPSKFIERYSGFNATHVIIRVNLDGSYSKGGKPLRIEGNSNELKVANSKRSKHGCLDTVMAIFFDLWLNRRLPITHVNNIIEAMRVF